LNLGWKRALDSDLSCGAHGYARNAETPKDIVLTPRKEENSYQYLNVRHCWVIECVHLDMLKMQNPNHMVLMPKKENSYQYLNVSHCWVFECLCT
jgi:hypothetical protein